MNDLYIWTASGSPCANTYNSGSFVDVILNNFTSHFLLHNAEESEIAHAAVGCGWLRVGLLRATLDVKRVQTALSRSLLPQTLMPFTDIKRSFMEARKLAGLPDVHIHDLRHSYASALAGSGVDLYTVGKLLGHVNVASTARYAHLANDTLMAAAEVGAAKLNVDWSQSA